MPSQNYMLVCEDLKNLGQPRNRQRWDEDPVTGKAMENVVLAVAPPDYPQLADGLEIGAIYEYEWKNLSHYCLFEYSSDYYFFDWCKKLVELTVGVKLGGGPRRIIQFCNDVSDLVMDKEKYAETEGRGPFWELLRYGVRGMCFGPAACAKLSADFDEWDAELWFTGDEQFYDYYCKLRECFSLVKENGLVYFPPPWMTEDEKTRRAVFIIEPMLGADPDRKCP